MATPAIRVVVHDGRLTVDVRNARLSHVLRAVAEQAGVSLAIRGDLRATITQSFAGVPLEEGFRRLLRGHSLIFFYTPARRLDELPALSQVSVIGSSPAGPGRKYFRRRADTAHARRSDARLQGVEALATPPVEPPAIRPGGVASRQGGPLARARRDAEGGPRGPAGDHDARPRAPGDDHPGASEPAPRSRNEAAAAELAQVLAEDADPLTRAQAAALLGIVGGQPAEAALSGALTDHDASVRVHAVRALGKVQGAGAVPALQAIVANDPDPRVRRVAVRWLAALPGAEARAAVDAAAADPDASVRQEVAEALATWQKPVP